MYVWTDKGKNGDGRTYNSFLTKHQRILNELALGREVKPVVEQFRPIMRHELIAQATDFAVHGEGFGVQMGEAEDGHGGGVVAASAFEADEAVLDIFRQMRFIREVWEKEGFSCSGRAVKKNRDHGLRTSTISIRPIPASLPISLSLTKSSRPSVYSLLPTLSLTGRPCLKTRAMSTGLSGADCGSAVLVHMSSGGGLEGSSRSPASYEQWAMFYIRRN